MYEISLQVPLIISGAGIPSGVVPHYVDHYDTFQTVCEMAGIALPVSETFAGQSYGPLLLGEEIAWDNTQFGEYGDLRMIRDERWKLVYRYPGGPHDLFDLPADPDERTSVFDACADVVTALKARLDKFYREHDHAEYSGLRVKEQPIHNGSSEAWRDGRREARGLQVY